MTDSSKRSISDVNKSNSQAKQAYKNGQGCSLLCHPFGLKLLQYYRKTLLPRAPDVAASDADNLYNDLLVGLGPQLTKLLKTQFSGASVATESAADGTAADAIGAVSNSSECGSTSSSDKSKKRELDFTKALAGIFNQHIQNYRHCRPPLVAEHQRRGEGQVSNCWAQSSGNDATGRTSYGQCDIAFSAKEESPDHKDDRAINETKESGKEDQSQNQNSKDNSRNLGDVVGILEVSLNDNCGLKKVTQALDYATTMCERIDEKADMAHKEYVIVWTLHLNDVCIQPENINKKQKLNQGQGQQRQQEGQQPTPPEQQRNQTERLKPANKQQDMEVRVYLCEISWDTKARTKDGKPCLRSKYVMVWREYTVISDGASVDTENLQEDEVRRQIENPRRHQQATLQEGVRSIARAVAMMAKLAEWKNDKHHEQIFEKWELKGPNCAKVSFRSDGSDCSNPGKRHFMLKVFDNRFTPTARSPYMWCDDTLCDRRLEVVPYFFLHEGCVDGSTPFETHSYDYQTGRDGGEAEEGGVINEVRETVKSLSENGRGFIEEAINAPGDESRNTRVVPLLGNPCPPREDNLDPDYAVPFGHGTVVILRYKYIEGSHWPGYPMTITGDVVAAGAEAGASTSVTTGTAASAAGDENTKKSVSLGSPRCFLPILNQLKIIHEKGYVHGDVRLFNMIFEKSLQPGEEGGAVLLDYDLGGKEGVRKYPEGYAPKLDDVGNRAGKGGDQLSRCDDLSDLISVLLCFQLKADCLSALQDEIIGWEKEAAKLSGYISAVAKFNIQSDEVPGLKNQEMEIQEKIDRLSKHSDIVKGFVVEWKKTLFDLEKNISEEQGKRSSAPDLTDELRKLESLLTPDEEVKRECGDLNPGFHLVFLSPDLEKAFNHDRKMKKANVATGSPNRELVNAKGREPVPRKGKA